MTAWIVHGIAVKFRAMFRGTSAARGERATVALAVIQTMIDGAVEMGRTVIPRACADEDSAGEPFRSVISVRRAVVGRRFVVSVGANGRASHGDAEVRRPAGGCEQDQTDCWDE